MGLARGVALVTLAGCYRPLPERACAVACEFDRAALCPGELACFPDNFCHDPAHPQCEGGADGAIELHNYAFVTADPFAVGTIGSIAAADAACQNAADAVPLAGTYHAWLASTQTTAQEQLGSARGWVRTDHRPFADRVGDLINNQILYPLRVDEHGVDHAIDALPVATGSTPDGTAEFTCGDYTSETGQLMTGHADAGIFKWTEEQTLPCSSQAPHLYCFGIDHDEPVVMTPFAGKRAFVSDNPFGPNTNGRDGADALCEADARAAGLGGTFLAVLATTTASAGSRFGDGPWYRLDGVELGTLEKPLASLEVTPSLMHYSGPVWTGATSLTVVGTAGTTCGDWVLFGGTGASGEAARSEPNALFFEGMGNCTNTARLYCLEP
jgi:hypothetical protein